VDKTTAYLVDYAMAVDYSRLSPSTIEACKSRLLDTLGCAFGAYRAPLSVSARELAHEYSGSRKVSVLGSAPQTTPEMAAFANGVMMRFLDMNDMYREKSGGHPSDVFAAVLAAAEAVRADGPSFITAAAIAYEIFCSFCDSIDINSKGWDQPVYGALGSALACGKLLRLSREQMGDAVALAVAPNMALMQTRRGELSSWKGCAAANGSRNAVFAALLAHKGFTGPDEVFEGRDGVWRAVGKFDWAPLDAAASPERITRTHLKCFAIGYHGQAAAWAAQEMRARVAIGDIEEIGIDIYRSAVDMMGTDASRWEPKTRETADHSLPYVVATVLLDGTIGDDSFSPEKLRDPRKLGLMRRTRVREDPAISAQYPEAAPCRITVRTKNGEAVEVFVRYPKGHTGNPLDQRGVEDKFRESSKACFGESEMAAIVAHIGALEHSADIGELLKLVQVKA
jgi:2-methylcitrate dehydratase